MSSDPKKDSNPYQSPAVVAEPVETKTPAPTDQKSFGAKAAQLSWQLPIVAIGVNVFLGAISPDTRSITGALLGFLILVGFLSGVIALISISFFGWRRILIPGCFGILINGGLIYFIIYTVFMIRTMIDP